MNYQPNLSYCGQYYFNPQWAEVVGGSNALSLIYNNVVNFTVGSDGTHYFHQIYSGQFIPPVPPTVSKTVRIKIKLLSLIESEGL